MQGVNTVKVWDCSLQCYDQRLITTGGAAVEGQYVVALVPPFEDKGHNDELDNFLEYDKKPDAFGAASVGRRRGIRRGGQRAIVAKSGPERHHPGGHARRHPGVNDFDASGFVAPDRHRRQERRATCFIGMQVQNGKFVRVDPVEPGTFDCTRTHHHDHDGPGEGVQGMSDRS